MYSETKHTEAAFNATIQGSEEWHHVSYTWQLDDYTYTVHVVDYMWVLEFFCWQFKSFSKIQTIFSWVANPDFQQVLRSYSDTVGSHDGDVVWRKHWLMVDYKLTDCPVWYDNRRLRRVVRQPLVFNNVVKLSAAVFSSRHRLHITSHHMST